MAIGSNAAANIFGRNTTPLFRDAVAGFPEFAFVILQLVIFAERKGRLRICTSPGAAWKGEGEARAGQQFCRFVTLQCINERTFIKAEIVFSAGANCRVARARERGAIDIADFPAHSSKSARAPEECFPEKRTLEPRRTLRPLS